MLPWLEPLGIGEAWSMEKDCGGQEANERRQMTEDRRQQAASQMVNLSTSQMVMNDLNDESTI